MYIGITNLVQFSSRNRVNTGYFKIISLLKTYTLIIPGDWGGADVTMSSICVQNPESHLAV